MKLIVRSKRAWLVAGVSAAFALSTAAADEPPATDTSDWKCTQCPFAQGYSGDAEIGVLGASGANATFGRYTGIDHGGAYADVSASGQYRSNDGSYANYELDRLGLASRDGYVEGGREGRYDLRVSYDGQPNILYDTGATPYRTSGSTLGLPAGWISAGGTAGMSALGTSLAPVNIESERRTVALLARYFASPNWTVFGEFRRQEHDGTGLTGASFLTEAVQLPQPFDYVTNSLEAGVAWAGRRASLRVSYLGSWFDDNNESITFANPYLPIVPGSTFGAL
ncbi:MAG: MtrB/PioB family outer membrane beta-barrel protein, partial [Steroidobacteraceae bacterium]